MKLSTNLINANSLRIPLANESVQLVCTSPPYYALRNYNTATFEGGDPACDHQVGRFEYPVSDKQKSNNGSAGHQARGTCPKCGAVRIDKQLGMESLHDCAGWATGNDCGQCYICNLRAWAREVWRVLRRDGLFFCNLGDSYAGSGGACGWAEWIKIKGVQAG